VGDVAADEDAAGDAAPDAEAPSQTANGPHHSFGTSLQLVARW
jgi:hypothetical protein